MSSPLKGARHRVGARWECDVVILDVRRRPNAAFGSRSVGAAADPVSLAIDLRGAAVEEERVRRVAKQVAHRHHGTGRATVARYDHAIRSGHETVAKMET